MTDTKESGFEKSIVKYLVEQNGYEQGKSSDFDKDFAVDTEKLFRFLQETQSEQIEKLNGLQSEQDKKKFLVRLDSEISKRGIVDVLRKGIKYYPADLIMFYQTPSENNKKAKEDFEKNIFSVTRQLHFSVNEKMRALDMCVFINGLPVITFELKNQLTHQNTKDAVEQYKTDRNPKDKIFNFKRCMVHFAVDDATIEFCTKLDGKGSWFLPFNKGYKDGAGNPPNPNGIMTSYLWEDILTKQKLALIIENYAQVVEEEDKKTKKIKYTQIFPRYHQLDAVTKLLADVKANGIGKKYLIQHSAGSGKSNSIAWLAHQLTGLSKDGKFIVDSVIVVTDRRILDKQIRDTIKQFMQVKSSVAWAEHSGALIDAIRDGKKIIVTTIEKFPFISSKVDEDFKNKKFAIIIDEAHSGQNGNNAAQMNMALSGEVVDSDLDDEDKINVLMKGRRLLQNASYFAFTATPKNKTLEVFGTPMTDENGKPVLNDDGEQKFKPFHNYSMKQAIQEGFILDVLKNYIQYDTFYKLAKTVQDDPLFDKKKAQKRLRNFVESNPDAIAKKAGIMVEHFHEQVIAKGKIGGLARAMVVTSSIPRCIEYFNAINDSLKERRSPFKAIIAFSGENTTSGKSLTSAKMNGFPDAEIPEKLKNDPYRILVVADMFQTGFDEPLLHTMYVDKILTDIKAVQTLSRLNRCHPKKADTCVLDFANKAEEIQKAFEPYYRTTILSGQTDPNKLYDLISSLEKHQVYSAEDVEKVVHLFLNDAERFKLDPVLDKCTADFKELELKNQVEFKGCAKAFVRTYGFIGAILPYGNADWEKLSIFLTLLLPKLPVLTQDEDEQNITEAVDLESYRNDKKEAVSIKLKDEPAEIEPVPAGSAGQLVDKEYDVLSKILSEFNKLWGNIKWNDSDNVQQQIKRLPVMVSKDEKYQNAMRNSDEQGARLECDRAVNAAIFAIMSDNLELFKQIQDNPAFKKWICDLVFNTTYNKDGKPFEIPVKSTEYKMNRNLGEGAVAEND
ncbi:MAG: type I restriction endonuclease [Treponema sp.]|nr:type I restriction endonuclease [Spirochaetia bacterium]MDD7460219.1 type I restriction endonuclease [Spirochaetales bacterium]MDY5810770.1 type I restriction endonuclease [Treponema sp.]